MEDRAGGDGPGVGRAGSVGDRAGGDGAGAWETELGALEMELGET